MHYFDLLFLKSTTIFAHTPFIKKNIINFSFFETVVTQLVNNAKQPV